MSWLEQRLPTHSWLITKLMVTPNSSLMTWVLKPSKWTFAKLKISWQESKFTLCFSKWLDTTTYPEVKPWKSSAKTSRKRQPKTSWPSFYNLFCPSLSANTCQRPPAIRLRKKCSKFSSKFSSLAVSKKNLPNRWFWLPFLRWWEDKKTETRSLAGLTVLKEPSLVLKAKIFANWLSSRNTKLWKKFTSASLFHSRSRRRPWPSFARQNQILSTWPRLTARLLSPIKRTRGRSGMDSSVTNLIAFRSLNIKCCVVDFCTWTTKNSVKDLKRNSSSKLRIVSRLRPEVMLSTFSLVCSQAWTLTTWILNVLRTS